MTSDVAASTMDAPEAPPPAEAHPLRPQAHPPMITPVEPAIQCQEVWKQYYFHAHRPRKLKEAVVQAIARWRPAALASFSSTLFAPAAARAPREPVWALRGLDLSVYPGEIVGVVGHNGAGKSTLLKLLSRILRPTRGRVTIKGRLGAVIELGAGFHEDLTAKENVHLAASLMGLSKRDIARVYDEIIDFADLAEHTETPVKYFSSGMHARLGFSIAVNTNPDVLLIDEVLAVGDANFQPKCIDTVKRFRAEGKAILFVSHDLQTVRNLCDRAVWLKDGAKMHEGPPRETVDTYLEHYWPGCTRDLAQKWTDEPR